MENKGLDTEQNPKGLSTADELSKSEEGKSQTYNPLEREKYWQKFWEEKGVYSFDPNSLKPLFTIDTPPPTISGSLHLGHIYSYTQAEVIARFKRMSGFNVRYPFGMDNNGLPTERLVEKEKGVKAEQMGLQEFISLCSEVTEEYRKKYKELWQMIGLSVDWNLEYSTISPEVQKISQLVFKQLFEDSLIYIKNAPALFCTECQTSFAQAEKESKEMDGVFYEISFKTESGENLWIATTRPELMSACTSVFVHPNDERYQKYIGHDVITALGDIVKVYTDDKVDPDKGTGLVMCCTYGDETDIYWARKYDLPEKIILDKTGRFTSNVFPTELMGKTVTQGRKIIVNLLKQTNSIRKETSITHSVEVHERCGTPIEFLPVRQWFVKSLEFKSQLIEAANTITWYPASMKKRFEEWVHALEWDWCISRERYYGIPIPASVCDSCGNIYLPTDDELPFNPRLSVQKQCSHCTGNIVPETSVLDTWFTSALTPEINNQSPHNGKLQNKLMPMSMRPQAHDIIRTWAFYSILMGILRDRKPWKEAVISGHILVKKGEKISKKTGGGAYKPKDLIETYSADAIRYAMCGAMLGKDSYFDEQEVKKGKKLVTKLYNAAKLILSNLDGFDPHTDPNPQLLVSDQWIIGRATEIAEKMSKEFAEYDFFHARSTFEEFFWREFCDNYLEIVKTRLYGEHRAIPRERISAQFASYYSLLAVLKMASPFIPHITEELFHSITETIEGDVKKRLLIHSDSSFGYFFSNESTLSIHNSEWPSSKLRPYKLLDESVKKGAELSLYIIAEIRKYKSTHSLRLGEAMSTVIVLCDEDTEHLLSPFMGDISLAIKAEKINIQRNGDDIDKSGCMVLV